MNKYIINTSKDHYYNYYYYYAKYLAAIFSRPLFLKKTKKALDVNSVDVNSVDVNSASS